MNIEDDVYLNQKVDNHFWAFYHSCKRQGDKVTIYWHEGKEIADLIITRIKQ